MIKKDFTFLSDNKSKFVVWGTGDLFHKICSKLDLNINEQVICFIETQPRTNTIYEKEILSINDYVKKFSESIEYNRILIASSFPEEICITLKKNSIKEELIFNGFSWYEEWPKKEKIKYTLPIFKYRKRYEYFLNRDSQHRRKPNDENEIVIFVKIWGYSLIPYFQITLGILLHLKGMKVKFLLDDFSRYDNLVKDNDFFEEASIFFISYLDLLKEKYSIQYEKISEQPEVKLSELEKEKIERTLYFNKVWQLRKTIFDNDDDLYYEPLKDQFIRSSKKIKGFLIKEKPKKVFAFTAAHLEFAILKDFCSLFEINIYSSENFRNSYSYSVSGPTVFQKDIALFNHISLPEIVRESLIEISNKHIHKISVDTDKNIINRPYVLIPLNIFWDSAAFTEKDIFKTIDEWLIKTIQFLIKECRITVVIRQHPHERKFGTGKDLKEKLYELFGSCEDFIFISCDEDINTYTLIKHANLILPNTSTVGVESAMLKKTVVVKNDVYYSDSGFVLAAKTEEEYFETIQNELTHFTYSMTESKIEKAKLFFALSSISEIPKTFGHDTKDVLKWIDSSMDDLLKEQSVEWLLHSIEEHIPLLFHKLGI